MQEDIGASKEDNAESVQRGVDLYEAWDTAEPGRGSDARAREWRARLPVEAVGSDK